MHKVPYSPWPGEENYQSFGEENQVVMRGRENHGCGEEYNVEKRERGSNIIFPLTYIGCWEEYQVVKRGKVQTFRGRKSRF